MTNPDTIAVIVGEMRSLSRLGYGNAAIANKISELADRLAALGGREEFVPCGFVVDGPSAMRFVPSRNLIEHTIKALCFEHGDDPDDYTATETFWKMTAAPTGGSDDD